MTHPRTMQFKAIVVRDEDNARQAYRNIAELAASIRASGLLEPLVVYERKGKNDRTYILKAGFRRYRAICQIRESERRFLDDVPVVVKKGNDQDGQIDNLAENIQRDSLQPGEIALGLSRLATGIKQADLAKRLGISASYVGTLLRTWAALDEKGRAAFVAGKIPSDVAAQLAGKNPGKLAAVVHAADEAEAREKSNGRGDGQKAARAAARKTARTRPTHKEIRAFVESKCGAEEGYWLGVRRGIEWVTGQRGVPDGKGA